MESDFSSEAGRWVRQAAVDLDAARRLADLGIHYAACFFAQQAAEKALKGALLARGLVPDRTHSVVALCRELEEVSAADPHLLQEVGFLDQYYIPTRYPDALPGGIPADLYGAPDSERAVAAAEAALEFASGP